MVLQFVYSAAAAIVPTKYWTHVLVGAFVLVVIYAYAQGRTTNRERDLHARVILLTGSSRTANWIWVDAGCIPLGKDDVNIVAGPFTPLGIVTLTALAKRGAHIIALSPYPLSHPVPSLLLPLIRSTTNNENIFAEPCDLTSATSIRNFCTAFLTANDTRIDAIVYAHEYPSIGRKWFFGGQARKAKEQREEEQRESASLASFLLTTLLLPALLVAPVERDIRIVSVVNPFYAAALPTLPAFLESTPSTPPSQQPLLISEGHRALRTIIVTRHLQRILDSLPNRAADVKSDKPPAPHPSNILSVSACPGISRRDTIAPFLGTTERGWSLPYMILLLPLLLFTKSSDAALQTLLHVLFLPTPLKRAQAKVDAAADEELRKAETTETSPEGESSPAETAVPRRIGNVEVLKPGALYRECAVVHLQVPQPAQPVDDEKSSKAKGKKKEESVVEDDGELGGEAVGRAVWEWYEARLKDWEAKDKERVTAEEEAAAREAAETKVEAKEGDAHSATPGAPAAKEDAVTDS